MASIASALDAISAAIKAMNSAIPGPVHGRARTLLLRSSIHASFAGGGEDSAAPGKFPVSGRRALR
jgi:hypothetical protein